MQIGQFSVVVMMLYTAQIYFRFWIGCHPTVQNINLNQQKKLSEYLSPRLGHNYFRFGKANVRLIGILLPVTVATISP